MFDPTTLTDRDAVTEAAATFEDCYGDMAPSVLTDWMARLAREQNFSDRRSVIAVFTVLCRNRASRRIDQANKANARFRSLSAA